MTDTRDRLADALRTRWVFRGDANAAALADALLPVVEAIAAEKAATELEKAADWFAKQPDERMARRTVARFLCDDAAALSNQTSEETHRG